MEVRFAKNHLRLGDAIGQRGDLSSPGIGQGKAWENHGKTMGKPWENIGKPWEIPGISVDCCGFCGYDVGIYGDESSSMANKSRLIAKGYALW